MPPLFIDDEEGTEKERVGSTAPSKICVLEALDLTGTEALAEAPSLN